MTVRDRTELPLQLGYRVKEPHEKNGPDDKTLRAINPAYQRQFERWIFGTDDESKTGDNG